MSVYPSIPATVEIKRGRFFGLVAGIAALAAVVTWAVTALAFDGGSTGSGKAQAQRSPTRFPCCRTRRSTPAPPRACRRSCRSRRPASRPARSGSATPSRLPSSGPTMQAVLASMSPQTRKYTQAIMNLTFAQLAAGAAGQP